MRASGIKRPTPVGASPAVAGNASAGGKSSAEPAPDNDPIAVTI